MKQIRSVGSSLANNKNLYHECLHCCEVDPPLDWPNVCVSCLIDQFGHLSRFEAGLFQLITNLLFADR